AAQVSGIIPGDWGKVGPGWLAQPLQNEAARQSGGGRIHQFLWRRSRAVSQREKGTERRRTIRNRPQPGQVARKCFGSGRIAVTQMVDGCYCAPARNGRLWRFRKGSAEPKALKGVTKRASGPGRIRDQARLVNLPRCRRC